MKEKHRLLFDTLIDILNESKPDFKDNPQDILAMFDDASGMAIVITHHAGAEYIGNLLLENVDTETVQ